MKSQNGLTLIEVLVALAILGIIIAVYSASFTSSLQTTRTMGNITDANTVLSFFGRMATGGASRTISFPTGSTILNYNYGSLEASFPELASADTNVKDANEYRVQITTPGLLAVGDIDLVQYAISVCWRERGNERCVAGQTAGPQMLPEGGGVN